MGTTVEVAVESEDPSTISRIAYVFDYFRSMEAEFSRFKEDSVLSQLNKAGQLAVSSRFLRLFALSKEAYEKTGGIFNPLVDVSAIGYSKSFDSGEFVQNDRHLATDFSSVYSTGGEIVLGRGRALDFGGIAKGYAVDNAALILLTFGYDHFFVNAGGDIFAHGFNGKENGWRIGIENPFNGGTLATFLLKDKAVATSGSYKRRWMS